VSIVSRVFYTWSHSGLINLGDNRNGFSQHGDYVFGWKGDSLQRAMTQSAKCFGDTCDVLERQTDEKAMECVKERAVKEDVDQCEFVLGESTGWV